VAEGRSVGGCVSSQGRLQVPERDAGFPRSSEESYHISSLLALHIYEHILILGNAVSKCLVFVAIPIQRFFHRGIIW